MPKVAVIGAGEWGLNYLRVLTDLRALGAVCETDQQRSSKVSHLYPSIHVTSALSNITDDENIKAVVIAAGSDMQHVIKTTVYLTNVADFPKMNAIYENAFAPHKPARATVEVSNLPKGALIEVEAVACV